METTTNEPVDGARSKLGILRQIVAEHQAMKIKDTVSGKMMLVDVQTARAILGVYEKLNDANRAKYLACDICKMGLLAWRLHA